MLFSLSIRNMLLVEKAEISFSSGLNVFTGETGAGKSIILDCLGFVLGNKSRNRFLRESCDSGEVVAEFTVNEHSPVREIFSQLSIKLVDTLVIRRVEFSDGKRKTYVNDTSCTLETIQKIGAELIEFVDQKEGSLVLKKSNHINLLDDFAGHKPKVASLQSIWKNIKAVKVEIAILTTKKDSLKEELDFIKYSLSELKNLAPKPGEIENLEAIKKALKSSSKINENLQYASNILSGGERRSELITVLNRLERASDLLPSNDSLAAVIGSLEGTIHELE
ncbi:MAG: AAA family ATPase, partial [Pseudomonadota bacterium]|nr:AAA family ATPase [Pseudomonadota bacterium]